MVKSQKIHCQNCGELTGSEGPCLSCGATDRIYGLEIDDEISQPLEELRGGQKAGTFEKKEIRLREKISGKTKRLARETQIYDRTHPAYTWKLHHVEELSPEGKWETVHDECVKTPAKRRPRDGL